MPALLLCAALLLLPCVLCADSLPGPPNPQTFISASGDNAFRILPLISPYFVEAGIEQKPLDKAVAFGIFDAVSGQRYDPARKRMVVVARKTQWYRKLVNVPAQAFVGQGNSPRVVAIDSYGRAGYEHALVIYGPQGKLVADLPLEALLTREELSKRVQQSVSSRRWADYRSGSFSPDGKTFSIRALWGRPIVVDLKTGRVLKTRSRAK